MAVLDCFDRAYVINLPHRTDRRVQIEAELAWAGIPFVPGEVELFAGIRPDAPGTFPSIGVLGCFMSHTAILKQAQQLGLRNVLIMEDDLQLLPAIRDQHKRFAECVNDTEWDILYLGHGVEVRPDGPIELMPYREYLLLAHCYAIHQRILTRLIDFLELVQSRAPGHPDGGPMHYDGALWTFRQQNPDVRTFLVVPNLGIQRSSQSDIAPPKWFDRVPILKQAARWARSAKVWWRMRGKR